MDPPSNREVSTSASNVGTECNESSRGSCSGDSWLVYNSRDCSLGSINTNGRVSDDSEVSDEESSMASKRARGEFTELGVAAQGLKHLRVRDRPNHDINAPSGSNINIAVSNNSGSTDKWPQVDVRMIDFAHTTCAKTPNSSNLHGPIHQGPDCGFLTGLDSLKRLLREILAEG